MASIEAMPRHRFPAPGGAPYRLDQRRADRLIKGLALALAGLLLGFGIFYYEDRYAGNRTPVVDQALRALEAGVRKDPANTSLRLDMANAYLAADKFDDSVQQYKEVLKIEPENQAALAGLGLAYTSKGQPNLAAEPFQKVADLNKDDPQRTLNKALGPVYYNLGAYRLSQNQADEAIALLHDALAVEPADADARYMLGMAQQKKGALDEAIASFQDAVRFVPDFAEAYQGLAMAYAARGDQMRAMYAQGMVSTSRKDFATAIKQLQAVTRAQPDLWEAQYGLGIALEQAGRRDEAVNAYRAVLTLKPDYQWARGALQRLGAN